MSTDGWAFFWLDMDIKCLGNCVGCLKVNLSLFSDLSDNELKIPEDIMKDTEEYFGINNNHNLLM